MLLLDDVTPDALDVPTYVHYDVVCAFLLELMCEIISDSLESGATFTLSRTSVRLLLSVEALKSYWCTC